MSIFDSIRFVRNNETVYKMLINGKWVESSDTSEIKSPVDGSLVARVQKANKDDAEKAVQAAFDAKPKIANMDASE